LPQPPINVLDPYVFPVCKFVDEEPDKAGLTTYRYIVHVGRTRHDIPDALTITSADWDSRSDSDHFQAELSNGVLRLPMATIFNPVLQHLIPDSFAGWAAAQPRVTREAFAKVAMDAVCYAMCLQEHWVSLAFGWCSASWLHHRLVQIL
jgi:hypothetical protein